jgi:hypothetical protein
LNSITMPCNQWQKIKRCTKFSLDLSSPGKLNLMSHMSSSKTTQHIFNCYQHSFKNQICDWTGEAVGSLVHRSNQWFIGSMSEPVMKNRIYFNTKILKLHSEVGSHPNFFSPI